MRSSIMSTPVLAIILNYNSSDKAIHLFNQLSTFYRDVCTPIIIDNYSNKIDREILKEQIPQSHLFYNSRNHGYGNGNNIGLKMAVERGFEYAWVLNPDISILQKSCLLQLLREIKSSPELAVVGPRIVFNNNPERIYSDGAVIDHLNGCKVTHLNFGEESNTTQINKLLKAISYVNGSAMLVKTDALKSAGFLTESFFMYYEEAEWCFRVKKEGYSIGVYTGAIVGHDSSSKTSNYYYLMERNKIWYCKLTASNQSKSIALTLIDFWNRIKFFVLYKRFPDPFTFVRLKGMIKGITTNP